MKQYLVIATLLFTTAANAQSREVSFVISAANTIDRSVKWQPASVLKADFTCQGKQEFAILGTKPKEIVVAVFRPPAKKPFVSYAIPAWQGILNQPSWKSNRLTLTSKSLSSSLAIRRMV